MQIVCCGEKIARVLYSHSHVNAYTYTTQTRDSQSRRILTEGQQVLHKALGRKGTLLKLLFFSRAAAGSVLISLFWENVWCPGGRCHRGLRRLPQPCRVLTAERELGQGDAKVAHPDREEEEIISKHVWENTRSFDFFTNAPRSWRTQSATCVFIEIVENETIFLKNRDNILGGQSVVVQGRKVDEIAVPFKNMKVGRRIIYFV